MAQDNDSPALGREAFHCPHSDCRAYAHQNWFWLSAVLKPEQLAIGVLIGLEHGAEVGKLDRNTQAPTGRVPLGIALAECSKCGKVSLWLSTELLWPRGSVAPPPNPDLPEQALRAYREAALIAQLSPRGGAALLRLAVEALCKTLSDKGKLDDAIAELVERGLDPVIQQALDSVRVIGNEAVHPGQMNLDDDEETVSLLFGLVNLVAEQTISRKRQVESIYAQLPEGKRRAIEERDAKGKP